MKLKQDAIEDIYRAEVFGWLKVLLELVDITKADAGEHLMMFFNLGEAEVLKMQREQLTDHVCAVQTICVTCYMYVCR